MPLKKNIFAFEVIDEDGQSCPFKIENGNKIPLNRILAKYAQINNLAVGCLQFTYKNEDISVDCGKTPDDFGMENGTTQIVVRAKNSGGGAEIASLHTHMDIIFQKEDMSKFTMVVKPFMEICNVLEAYSDIKKTPLNQLVFSHKGKRVPAKCKRTFSQLGMKHNEIVLVSAKPKSIPALVNRSKHKIVGQRVAFDYGGVTYFGTVRGYDEIRGWEIEYDNGDKARYSKKALIDALEDYEKHEMKDLGIVVKTGKSGNISASKGGTPLLNANVEFDKFLLKSDFADPKHDTFDSILEYWSRRHSKQSINETEASMILWHAIHSLSHFTIEIATLAGKKEKEILEKNRLSYINAYLWTYFIMRQPTLVGDIMEMYLKKNEITSDLLDAFPHIKLGLDASKDGTYVHYLNNILKRNSNRASNELTMQAREKIFLCFVDTKNDRLAGLENIDNHLPFREILSLYAEHHHIPLEKLQFIYLDNFIHYDSDETPALLGMKNGSNISVFRVHESETAMQMKFQDLPENMECMMEGGNEVDRNVEISFIDRITWKTVKYQFGRSVKLKEVLGAYSDTVGIDLQDLSFTHRNKLLFVTSIGKKTAKQLGMDDQDTIIVSLNLNATLEKNEKIPKAKPTKVNNKNNKKKKKNKPKSNRKKSAQPPKPPENEEENLRKVWMDAMASVFAEAEPTFKDIRQKLNALNLERTLPKQKKVKHEPEATARPIVNPPVEGLGGKAGKAQFIVQVGEVSNLYKTTKPSAMLKQASNKCQQQNIMIDLHGMLKEEALSTLDECLPDWIKIAMKGMYPWVIPVKIVCGGGNQILSEAVENWIKTNDQVANAPKSIFF